MPYYGDGGSYHYGPFANHSSLMTGVSRSFHTPFSSRYAPHLSTISESPLSVLRRYSPVTSVSARPKRIVDTADIDVSTPRNLAPDNRHQRHRLKRDRPTIKIRSQALKDNPALREYNQRHEKTVGELLVEKFLIKDKQNDSNGRIRLYHQASLMDSKDDDEEEEMMSAMQRKITRRMTRRRSSADVSLDAEQLQREAAFAQAQAEVLDTLVAEEQAELENEVRKGAFIKRGSILLLPMDITDASETDIDEDEDQNEIIKKSHKKTKKKRKTVDKPSPPTQEEETNEENSYRTGEEIEIDEKEERRRQRRLISGTKEDNVKEKRRKEDQSDDARRRRSRSKDEERLDVEIPEDKLEATIKEEEDDERLNGENEQSQSRLQNYKVEACNSVGDFSTMLIKATRGNQPTRTIEQFRESIRLPAPKRHLPQNEELPTIETKVVIPVRKPYVKDTSRNSVHLNLKSNNISSLEGEVPDEKSNLDKSKEIIDTTKSQDQLRAKIDVRDDVKTKLESAMREVEGIITAERSLAISDARKTRPKEVKSSEQTKNLRGKNLSSDIRSKVGDDHLGDDSKTKAFSASKVKDVTDNSEIKSASADSSKIEKPKQKISKSEKESKNSTDQTIDKNKSETQKNDESVPITVEQKESDAVHSDSVKPVAKNKSIPNKVSLGKEDTPKILARNQKNDKNATSRNVKGLHSVAESGLPKIYSELDTKHRILSPIIEKESPDVKLNSSKPGSKAIFSFPDPVEKVEAPEDTSDPSDVKKVKYLNLLQKLREGGDEDESTKKADDELTLKTVLHTDLETKVDNLEKSQAKSETPAKIKKEKINCQVGMKIEQKPVSEDSVTPTKNLNRIIPQKQKTANGVEKKSLSESLIKESTQVNGLLKKVGLPQKKSEPTEIDFWSEIKAQDSVKVFEMKSQSSESQPSSNSEGKSIIPSTAPKVPQDSKAAETRLKVEEAPVVTDKSSEEHLEKKQDAPEVADETKVESNTHNEDTSKAEDLEEDSRRTLRLITSSPSLCKSDSTIDRIDSFDISSSDFNSPQISEPTTPLTDISHPLSKQSSFDRNSVISNGIQTEKDESEPATPTNERSVASKKISKWGNLDNLSKLNDAEKDSTPLSSKDVSCASTPQTTVKKKKIVKRKKSTATVKKSEKKDGSKAKAPTKKEGKKVAPSPPSTPKTQFSVSPRGTPSQRPADLMKMFYTTPTLLLTATPRDLRKVRRAKAKRRKPSTKTASLSSDSTGSTRSTATTSTEDGSDADAEQKRLASTRSNDSGFDGSPRLSTPSQSLENQRNADGSEHFHHSGRITPPATNLPRFKKYEVTDFNFLKVLGKGSFGKVLLAELRGTDCVYAVKCLKKDVVLEDDDVECTLIERKVLTLATRHPYLCHLFCTFQTDSHLFFVMEYLNGGDLMFHIQTSGRFSEARARFYAAEIWSGLIFLHKKSIVYRDLKLDNVLLDFDGHIRIADFGMCKLQIFLDRTADTFCGTPDYMAPEIIKGLKYNQAVDWWSYGVLLYEMLTGQSPFSGCDEDDLFWSICNERPFIPRYLSQSATDILVALLEKDAGKRLPGHEIACHPFLHNIAWEKLERRQLEPPFKPALEHTLDTRYFDTAFTTERPRLTAVPEQILTSMDQAVFRGFSYTNPNATD